MISALIGGIGLFLLGMTLMTEGLKLVAGGALREVLGRFTGGPTQAFLSGAALTALVQSSSATIVTTIGFVSAGLLSFPQAIGVIFGAAVGTTSTGWLVSFLGLKYSVSILALPLVGAGALTRLLGRGRLGAAGTVVAGLGLIFVGIDFLQAGMASLGERVALDGVAGGRFGGRLLLILIGIVMTVVMQSSSAAVATTLAALHGGTIGLEQAASLVIGQNVGTTVTAALASIGAAIPARRTALAHILLNTFSGTLALVLLPFYLALLGLLGGPAGLEPTQQIALFHTTFTLVGVLFLLPVTGRYAALISRFIPERASRPTRFLDASVRSVPSVAVEASRRTVVEIGAGVADITVEVLRSGRLGGGARRRIDEAIRASAEVRAFLADVRSSPENEREYRRHLAVLHAIDHFDRLLEALADLPEDPPLDADRNLREVATDAVRALSRAAEWLRIGGPERESPDLASISEAIARQRRLHRPTLMARTAAGQVPPETALRTLDLMRWVDRAVYHVWRAAYHLGEGPASGAAGSSEKFEDPPEPSPGPADTGDTRT